jgi:hypothetical protein
MPSAPTITSLSTRCSLTSGKVPIDQLKMAWHWRKFWLVLTGAPFPRRFLPMSGFVASGLRTLSVAHARASGAMTQSCADLNVRDAESQENDDRRIARR